RSSQKLQDLFNAASHTRKDGCLTLGVRARLTAAQLFHQVEEIGWIVGLESNHELLVVEAERVAGVDLHPWKFVSDADVLVHRPLPLFEGQAVPGALF